MNITNFEMLKENYIDAFDKYNNEPYAEFFKWDAFKGFDSFRKEFDTMTSKEFPAKLKEALKGSDVLLNNGTVQPASGIVKLAEYEPETVHEMFRQLYAEDKGDLDGRMQRIWDFKFKSDELCEEYLKGKWKLEQRVSDIITYLCLYNPADNYLYKYTHANRIAIALGYPDSVSVGKHFSLKKYYKMCDEIKQSLVNAAGIMEAHERISEHTKCVNDNNHILIYDFMYTLHTYNLYTNVNEENKFSIKDRAKKEKAISIAKEIELLNRDIAANEAKLLELSSAADQIKEPELIGREVEHKKFGRGTVINKQGTKTTIVFGEERKLFQYPGFIAEGFVVINDQTITANAKKFNEINKQINQIKRCKTQAEKRIELLDTIIEKE